MQCKQVQIHLSNGEEHSPELLGHVSQCEDCAEFQRFERELVQSAKQWRDEEPSLDLERRIRLAVLDRQAAKNAPRRFNLLTLGKFARVASLVAVGAVAWSIFAPMKLAGSSAGTTSAVSDRLGSIALLFTGGASAEASFSAMRQHVAKAENAHVVFYAAPYMQPLAKFDEEWWKPGALRKMSEEKNGGDRLILMEGSQLMYHRYDPATRKVVSMHEIAPQPSFAIVDQGISLENLINAYNQDVRNLTMDPPEKTADGVQVVGHSDDGYHKFVFSIDPKSGLPTRLDMLHHEQGTWTAYGRLDFEFNRAIPKGTFSSQDLLPKP